MIANQYFKICLYFAMLCAATLFSTELPPGISYQNFKLPGVVSVHVLEVDPSLYNIIIGLPKDDPWDYVPNIARPYNSVAAVNGGFFKPTGSLGGIPVGAMKIDNEWHCATRKARGAIGWSNKNTTALIDQIIVSVKAVVKGKTYEMDGLNLIRKVNQSVLYNHHFYPQSTCTKSSGVEFIIKNGAVSKIGSRNSVIPKNGYVISADSYKSRELGKVKEGDSFSCSLKVVPQSKPPYSSMQEWEGLENVLGGKGVLIRAGVVQTDFSKDSMSGEFVKDYYPRTAVGFLANNHWVFVVVDGHQPTISIGMTLLELANFMLSLGCVDALNLDGGGSATMMLFDQVVNSTCGYDKIDKDSILRRVSDAFLIVPKNDPS